MHQRHEPPADLDRGITLPEGSHHVAVRGQLAGERWALLPQWNGRELWTSAVATMTPAGAVDRLTRPWARWLSFAWLIAIVGWCALQVSRRIGGMTAMAPERRSEIAGLGAKTIVSGTLATLMTAAVVGVLTPP